LPLRACGRAAQRRPGAQHRRHEQDHRTLCAQRAGRALVYNWRRWSVRLAHPKTRLEAITSRPKLLSAARRLTSHGGQKKILLSVKHEAAT